MDAICCELRAPCWSEAYVGSAVPQYAAAIEAAGSIGQSLKDNYLLSGCTIGLDATLALTAALQHAEEQDLARYHADVSRNPDRAGSGGIPHATIALARLGIGTDARGNSLRPQPKDGPKVTANLPLIDKDKGASTSTSGSFRYMLNLCAGVLRLAFLVVRNIILTLT
eukprot:SAG31_NODE_2019_length_6660_cov_2.597775_5_plen_168_part_00